MYPLLLTRSTTNITGNLSWSQPKKSSQNPKVEQNLRLFSKCICISRAWEEKCACLNNVSSGWMAGTCSWLGVEIATKYQEALGILFHQYYCSHLIQNLIEIPHYQESHAIHILTLDITLNTSVFLLAFINTVGFIFSQQKAMLS